MAVDVLNDVFKSISIYFNTLSQLGYEKQSDVNKLIIYAFIEEMLTGEMRIFVTEDDYRVIEQALTCLYGSSCLLPYPQYANNDSLFGHLESSGLITPRLAQDDNIRFTEDDRVRFKASN